MQSRVIIIIIAVILFGCSRSEPDARLMEIEDLASEAPLQALDSLNAIDYAGLSDADRHYYDFLMVKVPDKAYVTHTSDSLILTVIDYYRSHKSRGLYPEALYYGARVYSDLGDNPTAMLYFQEAWETLSDQDVNLELKANIASQYARLLANLRLYEESIPYMKKVLEIDSITQDSINLTYDLELYGAILIKAQKLDKAKYIFQKAYETTKDKTSPHAAKIQMHIANIKYHQGHMDSALYLIRDVLKNISYEDRPTAISYASKIYYANNILDTAYQLSHEIIKSTSDAPIETGYHILLSEKMRDLIPVDTLYTYIYSYRNAIEEYYNDNENRMSIDQQLSYNYQIHERRRIKVEKRNNLLTIGCLGFIILILLLIAIILLIRIRNKTKILELQETIKNIQALIHNISQTDSNISHYPIDKASIPCTSDSDNFIEKTRQDNDKASLREQLKQNLLALYNHSSSKKEVSPLILQSETYQKLQYFIQNDKSIPEKDEIWSELKDLILSISPCFITNLNLLTSGRLSLIDLHTAILIKCGIKPSHMKVIFGKSNGAIVSRRENLSLKIMDEKLEAKAITSIILAL